MAPPIKRSAVRNKPIDCEVREVTRPTVFKLIMVTILLSSAGGSPVAAQEREWYVREVIRDGAVEWTRESDAGLGEPEPRGVLTIEVTQHPGESGASDAQLRAADDLVQRSFASAREHGWYDIEKARGDGFAVLFGDRMHYANEAFVTDDRFLDPDRPELLLYYDTPEGMRLAGFMYLTRSLDAHGLQVGGPLTVWHFHVWPGPYCMLSGLLVIGEPGVDSRCARGFPNDRSPEMLHVWLLDHPEGSFATAMNLPAETIEALAKRRD